MPKKNEMTKAGVAASVIPAPSVALFSVSKMIGSQQVPPEMIAMLSLMGVATVPAALWTMRSACAEKPVNAKLTQSIHAISAVFLMSAVAVMAIATASVVELLVSAKLSFIATPEFFLHGLINAVYNTCLASGKTKRRPGVELASSIIGLAGAMFFLAAETSAYFDAKAKNDHVQMNAAVLAGSGVLGFIYSMGYGTFQGFQGVMTARKENPAVLRTAQEALMSPDEVSPAINVRSEETGLVAQRSLDSGIDVRNASDTEVPPNVAGSPVVTAGVFAVVTYNPENMPQNEEQRLDFVLRNIPGK